MWSSLAEVHIKFINGFIYKIFNMFEILHVVVQELRFKIFLVTGHGVLILKLYIYAYK